jgi:hypothetical protein
MTKTGLDGGGETGMSLEAWHTDPSARVLLHAQWCHHVCYPVLAKHIAKAATRLHATPWPVSQVLLRVEAADMV